MKYNAFVLNLLVSGMKWESCKATKRLAVIGKTVKDIFIIFIIFIISSTYHVMEHDMCMK